MIGARMRSAMSWTLMILPAWVSLSEPPKTVKSFEKTKTERPLTVPHPVTTPSPGTFCRSMPKSVERCSTIHVELLERVRVEQEFDPLARRQLAAAMLGRDAPLASARGRLGTTPVKVFDHVAQGPPS